METENNCSSQLPKKRSKGARKGRKRGKSHRPRVVQDETEEFSSFREEEEDEDLDVNVKGKGFETGVTDIGCGGSENLSTLLQESSTTMPETALTSRPKRLRGATLVPPTIAFTDRKTRSNSSKEPLVLGSGSATGGSNSGTRIRDPDEGPSQTVEDNGEADEALSGEIAKPLSDLQESCDEKEDKNASALIVAGVHGNGTVPKNFVTSMKNEIEEEKEADASKFAEPSSSQLENCLAKSAVKCESIQNFESKEKLRVDSPNLCNTKKVKAKRNGQSISGNEKQEVTKNVQKVIPSSSFGGSGGGIGKKLKIVEAPRMAPMLLMSNLPYMGELTFDTRPRRGRKPKKADICHLISKNYGIHFPKAANGDPFSVTPLPIVEKIRKGSKGPPQLPQGKKEVQRSPLPQKTNWTIVQSTPPSLLSSSHTNNRNNKPRLNSPSSFSSVLQKESLVKGGANKIGGSQSQLPRLSIKKDILTSTNDSVSAHDEPLNLCMRDVSRNTHRMPHPDSARLDSLSKNCSEIMNMKLPLLSSNLFSEFQLKPSSKTGHNSALKRRGKVDEDNCGASTSNKLIGESIRDLGLVSQLNFQLNLAKGASPEAHRLANSPSSSQGLIGNPLHLTTAENSNKKGKKGKSFKAGRDQTSSSDHPDGQQVNCGGNLFGHPDSGPNSGAQVSICKFKFTGGAKPSLQEKKMLSVDSGGNFRFYTDKDKVTHPSSSKTSNKTQGSSPEGENQSCQYAYSALPKSAKSMSVCMPVRPSSSLKLPSPSGMSTSAPTKGKTGTMASSPESLKLSSAITPTAQDLSSLEIGGGPSVSSSFHEDGYSSSQSSESGPSSHSLLLSHNSPSQFSAFDSEAYKSRKMRLKRKRRTRKSVMREKLEKTFKEKGFLIQTQQLESAEGATYCKFRQLRKFTRYLFRSWKDYLPDNVKEINNSGTGNASGSQSQPQGQEKGSSSPHSQNRWPGSGCSGGEDEPRGRRDEDGEDMELDLNDSQEVHPEEDEEEEEEEDSEDGTELGLIPEVTLTEGNENENTESEGSEDEMDVDVERVDDASETIRHGDTDDDSIDSDN